MNRDPVSPAPFHPWRGLTVRVRLLALCAALAIAFASGSLYLTYLFEQNNTDQLAGREQYRRFEMILDAEQAMGLYRHRGGQLNSALLLKDEAQQRASQTAYDLARAELDAKLTQLGSFDPASRDVVRTALSEVPTYSQTVMQALARGEQDAAAPALAELQKRLNLIEETLQGARLREFARAQEIQNQAYARANVARHLGAGITLMLLVSGALLIVTVRRSILRPLRITTEAIRQVNAGELAIDLPPISRDEFGDMAQAIRLFRDRAEKLSRLAYYDSLTGLGNRAKLEECLAKRLESARNDPGVVLFYLDLDNFRSVNQRVGHSLGDRYLCEAVSRFQRFIPADASLFRYSGDKFVALLNQPAVRAGSSLETELKAAAALVLRGVSEPYPIPNDVLNMSVSIGIAIYPDDGGSAEQLVTSAEAASFAAKKSGRNNARFAGGKLAGQLRAQKGLANEIRRGLERGEFEVYYQPIIDHDRRRVAGAEALLRWQHPDRGLLMASQFITIAEEEGLIGPLALQCMQQVHRQAETWARAGHDWRVAVNISAKQLQDGDILDVLRALRPGRDAESNTVDLELTETVLFDTSDETRQLLGAIRQLGYRIGMDDFGTGYSSFNYLQWLPIDKIKIDRQFVSTMEVSRQARGIISATIALAQNLELDVVAEGVETAQQARQLASQGCTLQQGFHYAPALPAAGFELWAAGHAARSERSRP